MTSADVDLTIPAGAYPEERAHLHEQFSRFAGASETFARPLRVCSAGGCSGQCCSTGAEMLPETARRVAQQVADRPADFARLGVTVDPNHAVVIDEVQGTARTRIQVRVRDEAAPGVPPTACVLLTPDGRCSLQALAVEDGVHPWAYKPPICFLYPVRVGVDDTNHTYAALPSTDWGCPPCAQAHAQGTPALSVLEAELRGLETIVEAPLRPVLAADAARHPYRGPMITDGPPPARNEPCPCGSGKKYKQCHGR